MATQEAIKKTRKTLRRLAAVLINKAEDALTEENPELLRLKQMKGQLKEKMNNLKKLDSDYCAHLIDEKEIEDEVIRADEYLDKLIGCDIALEEKISQLSASSTTPSLNPTPVPSLNELITNSVQHDSTMKLPKANSIKFDGKPSEWSEFWGNFEAMIDLHPTMHKKIKLVHLKNCLVGEAGNVVKKLAVTEDNYELAKTLLKERFGRDEIVKKAHLHALMRNTPVKRVTDVVGLKRLYDACEDQVRGLQSLNVSEEFMSEIVCPMILGAMPDIFTVEYSRKHPNDKYDVKNLLDTMRNEIFLREKPNSFSSLLLTQPTDKSTQRNNAHGSKGLKSTSVFTTQTEKKGCWFCGESNHAKEECRLTVAERKEACRKQGRCFRCLERRHVSRECPHGVKCEKCKRHHHTLICDGSGASAKTTDSLVNQICLNDSRLPVVAAKIKKGDKSAVVNCLIDTGSQTSFIVESVAVELNLPPVNTTVLNVTRFEETQATASVRKIYDFVLMDMEDDTKAINVRAVGASHITRPTPLSLTADLKECLKRNQIRLLETKGDSNILLLLGTDLLGRILTGKSQKLDNSIVGLETIFGWFLVMSPPTDKPVHTLVTQVMKVQIESPPEVTLDETLTRFWELDSLGIKHESRETEDKVFEQLREGITKQDDRYEVALPWITDPAELANNYRIAEQRLRNLIRRFRRAPGLYGEYKKIFDEQKEQGIIEEVADTDCSACYYMPHRPVVREQRSTTKIRIVFDASSSAKNELSLNDCLDKGPNLLPELLKLLMTFRANYFAYTADIEKAFLQLSLRPCDRNYVRFLWIDSDWDGEGPSKIVKMRQTRVVFGATSSPFLLNGTIKIHLESLAHQFPDTTARLAKRFYVDDLIDSVQTRTEAERIFFESNDILSQASLRLRKWCSNSPELRQLYKQESAKEGNTTESFDTDTTTVLGLKWNFVEDMLCLELGDWCETDERIDSKRGLIQTVARIYDPLGLVSPFTVRGKFLFQELWLRNVGWDEELPADIKKLWVEWYTQIRCLKEFEIPRPLYSSPDVPLRQDLHLFCDASPRAYGVVVYMRCEYASRIEVTLCMSKTRVAPIKKLTLPKLELMGAVLLARINQKLSMLNPDSVFHWTDSSITYFWIQHSTRKTNPFVRNRVQEICDTTHVNNWRHIPGKFNPADKLTRGMEARKLIDDEEWIRGPLWLRQHSTHWPNSDVEVESNLDLEDYDEVDVPVHTVSTDRGWEPLPNPDNYSSWNKLMRLTAWMLRFIHNSRGGWKRTGPLMLLEWGSAERLLISNMQRARFALEIDSLKKSKPLPSSSTLSKVVVFLDDFGIMRVNSRIKLSDQNEDFVCPIVLDDKSNLTHLIILSCHLRTLHGGLGDTLSEFRSRFWTLRARKLIKTLLRKCVVCRRVLARPLTQEIAPLPADRTKRSEPFRVVGIDFAGPFYLRNGQKVWIALFTCAVVRALHLELVSGLSTEIFILAFKRFISRRGLPSICYSDNAKTFKRTEKDLLLFLNSFEQELFQGFLSSHKIEWKFIIELAPWWGGWWERLVKSTKISLKKIVGKSSLDFEEFTTTLTEIEGVLNSRPITYVDTNPSEQEPLTPAHFLVGKRLITLPDVYNPATLIEPSTRKSLLSRWRHRQRLINLFWRRWVHEYLVELREFQRVRKSEEIHEDDVVLIEEPGIPRMSWKLARVAQTFPGRDRKVRACELALPDGRKLRRPIQRLCHLEVEH